MNAVETFDYLATQVNQRIYMIDCMKNGIDHYIKTENVPNIQLPEGSKILP